MIVPQYWAEARIRDRINGRQVTVRRWGWSDESQAAAQAHADGRASEALARIRAGERVPRRERKIAYNGADGFPIREELIARHGDTVISRNSYGALCLNTPNVLFIDIDFPELPFGCSPLFLLIPVAPAVVGYLTRSWFATGFACLLSFWFIAFVSSWLAARAARRIDPYAEHERAALARVQRFVEQRPDWEVRVYRTPAGLRVLVTHRTFDPDEPEAQECFDALGADPLYVRMCRNQKCFRARVSPKPWRVGIDEHLRPRPGVWPVDPEWLPGRAEWVAAYEAAAEGFAACRFVDAYGRGGVHPAVRAVMNLHDSLARATSDLPLA